MRPRRGRVRETGFQNKFENPFVFLSLSFLNLPLSKKKKKNSHLADALELPWPSPEAVEALSLLEEPVVLRGGARSFLSSSSSSSPSAEETEGWCHRWSLDALARGNPRQRVLVRAAPSPSFPVPNGALLPLVVAALGPRAAPSLASLLPLREAAERMQAGCPLPPLAFSSQASPFSSLSSLFLTPLLPSASLSVSLETRKNATGQPNPRPPPRGGLCPGKRERRGEKGEREKRGKRRERKEEKKKERQVEVKVEFFSLSLKKKKTRSETSATSRSTAT